jgi:hypothetical protein
MMRHVSFYNLRVMQHIRRSKQNGLPTARLWSVLVRFRNLFRRLFLALARFFGWLGGRTDNPRDEQPASIAEESHGQVEVGLHPPEIGVEELARSMNLEALGRERGLTEQPPSDAAALDPVEITICHEIEKRFHAVREEWERVAALNELHAEAAKIDAQISRILEDATIAVSALRAEAKVPLNQSFKTRENARESKQHLDDFRRNHGLTRPAQYSESRWGRVASIVGLVMVIETFANGSVLATGLYGGEFAGWSWALIFAGFNAGGAFLWGLSCRYIFHRKIAFKLIGFMLILFAVLYAAGLNLGVAHFRDALSINPDDAPVTALRALREHPLEIANLYSALLLVMGGAFFLIAFVEGIGFFEDPYPGYGRLTRRNKQAFDDFSRVSAQALERLAQLNADKLRNIRIETDHVHALVAAHAEKRKRVSDMRARLNKHRQALEVSANRLADIYRQANLRARTTPAPIHFRLPLQCAWSGSASDPEDKPPDFALDRLTGCSGQIVAAFEQIQQSFPTLEDL